MRFSIPATIRRLLSVDRNSLLLAGFNLVAGIVITALLVIAARDTAYPPTVGLALALLVGGGADVCHGLGLTRLRGRRAAGRARRWKELRLRRRAEIMNEHEETRHFRTQAVTMLAIATGVRGRRTPDGASLTPARSGTRG